MSAAYMNQTRGKFDRQTIFWKECALCESCLHSKPLKKKNPADKCDTKLSIGREILARNCVCFDLYFVHNNNS